MRVGATVNYFLSSKLKFVMQILVPKYQPVEIVIPAGTTQNTIQIENQSSLYNKRIVGLEMYPKRFLEYSPITNTKTVNDDDIKLLTLEFFDGSDQICKKIPLVKLNRLGGDAGVFNNDYLPVNNWLVSWDKCNLYITNTSAMTDNTGVVVTLGVYYYDLPKEDLRGV